MIIDNVEKMWQDLEATYKRNGKIKDRRKFAEALVYFDGTKGAVAVLESNLKMDLTNDPDAIERYNNLCNLLEKVEDWLLQHPDPIHNLNEWLAELTAPKKLDLSRLAARHSIEPSVKLKDAIQSGYVLPGTYGNAQVVTTAANFPGYYYLETKSDVANVLQETFDKATKNNDAFSKNVLYALYKGFTSLELTLPCAFISDALLKSGIKKYKKVKSICLSVDECIRAEMHFDLKYDVGIIAVSSDTNVPVIIVKEATA